jgi:hypothetical protein
MKAAQTPYDAGRARLDRLVDAQLRAEHDGDIEAIVAPMADVIVHDMVGSENNPVHGTEAVRTRYRDLLAGSVHERDLPLRRLYGRDLVLDEHIWTGRLTGRAFETDGRGQWLSYRVLWLLEVTDGQIVRQTVWSDRPAIGRHLP